MNEAHINALLAERAAYAKAKKPKRVAECDRELARYGVKSQAKKAPKKAAS